jgi:hypothetical protein
MMAAVACEEEKHIPRQIKFARTIAYVGHLP